MTERLLAALTDNGKWLGGFTRLGYESTFREYCDRFTPDYLAAVREAGLIGGYLWDSSRFEGLFPQIISQLSLFARFYTIVNGVFDVTAIVYYLSVTGFFLFLSVQSLEKRRWSE